MRHCQLSGPGQSGTEPPRHGHGGGGGAATLEKAASFRQPAAVSPGLSAEHWLPQGRLCVIAQRPTDTQTDAHTNKQRRRRRADTDRLCHRRGRPSPPRPIN